MIGPRQPRALTNEDEPMFLEWIPTAPAVYVAAAALVTIAAIYAALAE